MGTFDKIFRKEKKFPLCTRCNQLISPQENAWNTVPSFRYFFIRHTMSLFHHHSMPYSEHEYQSAYKKFILPLTSTPYHNLIICDRCAIKYLDDQVTNVNRMVSTGVNVNSPEYSLMHSYKSARRDLESKLNQQKSVPCYNESVVEDLKKSNQKRIGTGTKENFNRSDRIMNKIVLLMDESTFINRNEEQQNLIDLVTESGNEGIRTFNQCFSDSFDMRVNQFSAIWNPALEIVRKTRDEELFTLIEKVIREGGDLVNGIPRPPHWMPSMNTDIIGGGRFGWADDTRFAHEGAEFIKDNLSIFPADRQDIFRKKFIEACEYRGEILMASKTRGTAINPQKLDEEIEYWRKIRLMDQ